MKGSSYRLKTPTLGILSSDRGQNRIPVTILLHAVVTAGESVDGNVFIEVTWEDKVLLMFIQDLQTRAELVNATTQ